MVPEFGPSAEKLRHAGASKLVPTTKRLSCPKQLVAVGCPAARNPPPFVERVEVPVNLAQGSAAGSKGLASLKPPLRPFRRYTGEVPILPGVAETKQPGGLNTGLRNRSGFRPPCSG